MKLGSQWNIWVLEEEAEKHGCNLNVERQHLGRDEEKYVQILIDWITLMPLKERNEDNAKNNAKK